MVASTASGIMGVGGVVRGADGDWQRRFAAPVVGTGSVLFAELQL
ncbi:hypothetical protein L195_g014285 [Trifolium pratense]|uniref:Uncharacterized protein n=1 Tax=Trifolium pratense TaxID=57577 RepID=A0A2K3PQH4_TRIPR|nr:hypothetical protein L195_g049299 [Trifolium pratense]PNY17539.1 hypothetical protein L195_g014285 [Trifolium pratense]